MYKSTNYIQYLHTLHFPYKCGNVLKQFEKFNHTVIADFPGPSKQSLPQTDRPQCKSDPRTYNRQVACKFIDGTGKIPTLAASGNGKQFAVDYHATACGVIRVEKPRSLLPTGRCTLSKRNVNTTAIRVNLRSPFIRVQYSISFCVSVEFVARKNYFNSRWFYTTESNV